MMMRFGSQNRFLFATIGMVLLTFIASGCVVYTRHTPEEVRQAITAAGVVGSTPDETITRLKAIRLAGGHELNVGRFLPDRNLVEATVADAKRTLITRWSVDVVVSFDSARHASKVDVRYAAVNPM